jgi:hypothetical protein
LQVPGWYRLKLACSLLHTEKHAAKMSVKVTNASPAMQPVPAAVIACRQT